MLAATGHSSPMNSWIMNKRVWHFLRAFCPSCCSEPDGHIMERFCCFERPRRNFRPHFHVTVDQRGHREINANQRSPFCLSFTSGLLQLYCGNVNIWKQEKKKVMFVPPTPPLMRCSCLSFRTEQESEEALRAAHQILLPGGGSQRPPLPPVSRRHGQHQRPVVDSAGTLPKPSNAWTPAASRFLCLINPSFFFFVGRLPSFSFSWIQTVPQMSLPWSTNTHRFWKTSHRCTWSANNKKKGCLGFTKMCSSVSVRSNNIWRMSLQFWMRCTVQYFCPLYVQGNRQSD